MQLCKIQGLCFAYDHLSVSKRIESEGNSGMFLCKPEKDIHESPVPTYLILSMLSHPGPAKNHMPITCSKSTVVYKRIIENDFGTILSFSPDKDISEYYLYLPHPCYLAQVRQTITQISHVVST